MKIDGNETATKQRPSNPPPMREDCWTEDATYTLIEAWGDLHLELKRGNLRQKHWQEVADIVNAHHGTINKKSHRTIFQCINRIDTLKKKYKIEKSRILSSDDGALTSSWPFYYRLDFLIGTSTSSSSKKLPLGVPRLGKENKEKSLPIDDSKEFFPENYSAAAMDSGLSRSSSEGGSGRDEEVSGFKELAKAIVRFGEIYERVEETKQRQLIEFEKERMAFLKSLEFERMQLYVDTQIQIEKIKRAK